MRVTWSSIAIAWAAVLPFGPVCGAKAAAARSRVADCRAMPATACGLALSAISAASSMISSAVQRAASVSAASVVGGGVMAKRKVGGIGWHRAKLRATGGGVTVERGGVIQPGTLKSGLDRSPASAKAVVEALVIANGGAKQVSHRLGVSDSLLYDFMHPGSEKEMSLARAAALTSPSVPFAAEYLAGLAGGVFLPIAGLEQGGHALGHLTAEFARETGEAVAVIIGSLSDGQLSADEAEADLREVDQAMRVLAAIRSLLLAKVRQ